MATNAKPVYKRILLKLSGEALQGTEGFGIDASMPGPAKPGKTGGNAPAVLLQ